MKVAILAVAMSERYDAVCNDVAHHYRLLSETCPLVEEVRVFAGAYDATAFPDVPVETFERAEQWLADDKGIVVLLHYCDGHLPQGAQWRAEGRKLIVRWHNATPPWFTFGVQNQNANHALLGYRTVMAFIDRSETWFWGNSDFTREQLLALGASAERCRVVYPASRYLDSETSWPTADDPTKAGDGFDLLFVSRVVAHKGHTNAIALADRVREITDQPVRLHIVGKGFDEPSAFSTKLRDAIKAARAEIVVHGAIPDDALMSLYRHADVFICLSEHEGFGLPVFEAMRHRLPVVAWATTAFRTLLADHPFAFPNFDLDLFAAAVAALKQPGVKTQLLEVQYAIARQYTAAMIAGQVNDALAAVESPWGQPANDDLMRAAVRFRPDIAQALDTAHRRMREVHPKSFDDTVAFDAHINVTSLYDLRMFKDFIRQKQDIITALTTPVARPSVMFPPAEFSLHRHVGTKSTSPEDNGPTAQTMPAAYLVFGPYARLPVGQYEATMDAVLTIDSDGIFAFEIDVSADGQECVKRSLTLGQGIYRLDEPIAFGWAQEGARMELRLRAVEPFLGSLVFSGATVTKTDVPATVGKAAPASGVPSFTLPTLTWPAWGTALRRMPGKRRARRTFRQGNAARDAGQWVEAARLYDAGLEDDPDNFAYLVQAGHMYKEAGVNETALSRYAAAYRLNPGDADLCLQMGHFFKMTGDKKKARDFYEKALSACGDIAADAGGELASMGGG